MRELCFTFHSLLRIVDDFVAAKAHDFNEISTEFTNRLHQVKSNHLESTEFNKFQQGLESGSGPAAHLRFVLLRTIVLQENFACVLRVWIGRLTQLKRLSRLFVFNNFPFFNTPIQSDSRLLHQPIQAAIVWNDDFESADNNPRCKPSMWRNSVT